MTAPVGWKNLSPIRRKATSRETIRAEVQELYPDAYSSYLSSELLAFFVVNEKNEKRLVALTWIDGDGVWNYVVQSRVAFDIGMNCKPVQIAGNRYRVLPVQAEKSPAVQRQMRAQQSRAQRFGRYRPEYRRFQPYRYRDDGNNWWIEFKVWHGVERHGPYPSNYALDKDLNRLLEALVRRERVNISESVK